jgi:hypothetical protein
VPWAHAESYLGFALTMLSRSDSGTEHLHESIAASNQALLVYSPKNHPMDWSFSKYTIGVAQYNLALRERSGARLKEAEATLNESQSVLSKDKNPEEWTRDEETLDELHADLHKFD